MEINSDVRKIAFIGTSCIGKTALLNHYKERFSEDKGFAFVEEAARDFFQRHPEITDRFSEETQGKIQALALEREQIAQRSGARVILCDRSAIDAVAYVRVNGDLQGAERLFNNVAFWLCTYYRLILLDPADIPYVPDDVRQESPAERQRFHEAFLALLDEKQIPYELLSGTLAERIERVDEILTSNI